MGDTAIGWTHRPGTRGRTWNPVRGCRRKSDGCLHCYAEVQAARIVRMGKGKPTPYDGLVRVVDGEARWTGEIALDADRLAEPLRWRDPSTVFVDSMSDLFFDERPDEHIAAVYGVMAACPRHTFIVLTKYADRMRAWYEWVGRLNLDDLRGIAYDAVNSGTDAMRVPRGTHWPPDNVWLGVSTENQETYIERVRQLHFVPAAKHLISAEPLLGAIDMSADSINPAWLDWVVTGCESGPDARPCDVAWLRSLRDQCQAAGVPLFLKQAMRLRGADEHSGDSHRVEVGRGSKVKAGDVIELPYLDGEQHAEFPR